VYSYQHEPKPDEAAAAQLAAFLAAQLRSVDGERTEKVRGGVQIRAAIEKELPDDPLVVGRSPAIRRVLSKIHLASRGDVSVLIQGESGTGKELVAKRVHQLSARASRPFVAIDCAAIPENLVESELFGYRKAAFTGAERDKYGVFEDVNGGTLLLDEIGNASINFQAKLLRVLQEKEIRRIGETRARAVDVRVVAATNADLKTEAAAGRFREDLLYRISVVTIDVPPLRERLEDIPLIVTALLQRIQMKGTKVGSLTREVLHGLMHYTWPGNVRELGNALQAAALAADGAPILPEHLPESVFERGKQTTNSAPSSSPTGLPPETDADRERLLDALRQVGGDKSAACRILGWNRMKLYRRLKRYNLPLNLGKSEKA
jgi:two-component system response regulator AtoC